MKNNLKEIRKILKINQKDFAKLIKVSKSVVSAWENNSEKITEDKVDAIVHALNIERKHIFSKTLNIKAIEKVLEAQVKNEEDEEKMTTSTTDITNNTTQVVDKIETPAFVRESRIQKGREEKTIKSLYKNRERLRFDLAIQRGEVWTLEQKSDLIHSILYGYPVPPVMVRETDDRNIWFLDGKQRLTSILGFIKGDYALSKKAKNVYGFEIAEHKFKDLPEDMQDTIYDETITLIKLKNMTEEEVDTLFVKWNSGSTLTNIELTRAMHSDLIEQINHISELEFFAEDVILTSRARNRFVDQEIIFQIAMLLDEGAENIKGFGSVQIKDYVLRLKEVGQILSDKLVLKFEDVSKYLNMAVSDFSMVERKKALKRINVPIIFSTAIKAMDLKVKPNLFGEFVRTFLVDNYRVDSDYGRSCQSGSSKKENVLTRLNEMNNSLDSFLAVMEDYSENTVKAIEEFEKEHKKEIEKQVEENKKEIEV